MVKLNIYDLELKVGKKGEFYLLNTDIGNAYVFPNNFKGDFSELPKLEGKLIDGKVTCGEYPQLKEVDEVLGKAKEVKRKDKDRIISRIACVNSAIKMIDTSEESPTIEKTPTIVFNIAETIFDFINK